MRSARSAAILFVYLYDFLCKTQCAMSQLIQKPRRTQFPLVLMMPQLISKPCAVKLGISFLSRPQIRWHPDRFLVLNSRPATVLSHFIFRHAGCAACILFQDFAAAMPTPGKLIRQQLFLPGPLFLPSLPCRHRRRRRRRLGGQLGLGSFLRIATTKMSPSKKNSDFQDYYYAAASGA